MNATDIEEGDRLYWHMLGESVPVMVMEVRDGNEARVSLMIGNHQMPNVYKVHPRELRKRP